MYIVRWLMGHPIMAFWTLGAIAILLTAGGNNTHENRSTEHLLESTNVIEKHDVAEHAGKGSARKEDERVNVHEKNTLESINGSVGSTLLSDPVVALNSANENAPKDTEVETYDIVKPESGSQEVTAVIMGATTESDSAVEADEVKVLLATDKVDGTAVAKVIVPNEGSDLGQVSVNELLLMAREAYWNNGLDESAGLYTQLIKLKPDVVEYKGELGNVYWKQGHPKKAAELYSEIAIPMLQRGNTERVVNMIGFIGIYYPEKAKEIHQKIMLMQGGK